MKAVVINEYGDERRTRSFQVLKQGGLNQLWVADITYIRLVLEFVYLAVILDAFLIHNVS